LRRAQDTVAASVMISTTLQRPAPSRFVENAVVIGRQHRNT